MVQHCKPMFSACPPVKRFLVKRFLDGSIISSGFLIVKRFLDIFPKNFEPLRRLSSWASGLGIFPGCAAAPGLGWAAGQFLPPPGRGICTPGRPGRVSVESTAKIKKSWFIHVGLVGQNCIFPILFLSRASTKRSYSKIEKYPTNPTSENPQNTKRLMYFLVKKTLDIPEGA